MRILIVGYGSMGRRHAATARALGAEVLVCDPYVTMPDGIATIPLSDVWFADPDRVVIATPAATHLQILAAVTQDRPRPVYLEKPLAASVHEVWAAAHISDGVRAGVTVGYNMRYLPGMTALRHRYMRADDCVPAEFAHFVLHCDRATWPGRGYASTLVECSHEIDLALYLFGPARVVSAVYSGVGWTLVLQHTCGTKTVIEIDDTRPVYVRRGHVWRTSDRDGIHWQWSANLGERAEFWRCPDVDGRSAHVVPPELTYREAFHAWMRGHPSGANWAAGEAALRICAEAERMVEEGTRCGSPVPVS